MDIYLNKSIKVGVVFKEKKAQIIPRWFITEGRQYKIDQVNYVCDEKKGKGLIKHFAVMSEYNCYELVYDTEDMVLCLTAVHEE